MKNLGHKDEAIDRIARRYVNIAQCASFAPDGTNRIRHIRGLNPDEPISMSQAAEELLRRSNFVNIRSSTPTKWDNNPFLIGRKLGLDTVDKIVSASQALLDEGYWVIFNEDINVNDGGFSGVLYGNVAEFAPQETPRCVEKPGCALLSWDLTMKLIQTVYGFRFTVPYERRDRVEFSIHPNPVGLYGSQYVIWQEEKMRTFPKAAPRPTWPNRYSRFMGDKAYGLLMAHLLGCYVPFTRVFSRNFTSPVTSTVAFNVEFGQRTEDRQPIWIRTCPTEQNPGYYPTHHDHADPFMMMAQADPDQSKIASLIYQDGVEAAYSGAALTDARGRLMIEGVSGSGDKFMLGGDQPIASLPGYVTDAIHRTWEDLTRKLDGARFEWVYSERSGLWVVQLHCGKSASVGDTIYPGKPDHFERFLVTEESEVWEAFQDLVDRAKHEGFGIVLVGNVGITSHWGDRLRRNAIPSIRETVRQS